MQYNTKVIFGILVACSWLLVLYYNYEEVLLSACYQAPDHPQPVVVYPQTTVGQSISIKELPPPNVTNIGFAFIMLVHNLKTIKTALVNIEILQDPRNFFVVHIDRKVSQEDSKVLWDTVSERGFKNVKVISTQSIKWGGRELLPAALDGMTLALEWPEWHYVFLMSGDCLPIKSLSQIRDKMVKFYPKNGLAINDEPIFERSEVGDVKRLRFRLPPGQTFDDQVKGLKEVYYGTTWVTVTRQFVVWTLSNSFARDFLLYLTASHTDMDVETGFPSIFEESFFQTIVYYSPFKDTVTSECIRFEKWGGCNYVHEDRAVPCMLGDRDVGEFDRSDCIFARKFVYKELPGYIKKQLKDYEKLL